MIAAAAPLQPAQAPVRNGHSLAKSGRAELLAGRQALDDARSAESLIILEQLRRSFQRRALVARVDVQLDVGKAAKRLASRFMGVSRP